MQGLSPRNLKYMRAFAEAGRCYIDVIPSGAGTDVELKSSIKPRCRAGSCSSLINPYFTWQAQVIKYLPEIGSHTPGYTVTHSNREFDSYPEIGPESELWEDFRAEAIPHFRRHRPN